MLRLQFPTPETQKTTMCNHSQVFLWCNHRVALSTPANHGMTILASLFWIKISLLLGRSVGLYQIMVTWARNPSKSLTCALCESNRNCKLRRISSALHIGSLTASCGTMICNHIMSPPVKSFTFSTRCCFVWESTKPARDTLSMENQRQNRFPPVGAGAVTWTLC